MPIVELVAMPAAAIGRDDAVDAVLPVDDIAQALIALVSPQHDETPVGGPL